MIKIFYPNDKNKIELTKEELEKLLQESRQEGYNEEYTVGYNHSYSITYPNINELNKNKNWWEQVYYSTNLGRSNTLTNPLTDIKNSPT